jgi:predicted molibdopterin-dependent oxidoreductase YjgC
VVEVAGVKPLLPACLSRVSEGMQVATATARVERSRRTILEMLASAVDLSEAPAIQKFLDQYHADRLRFPEGDRRDVAVLDDNPMYIRDYAKCILCWRCVQVCADDAQFTYAINFKGRGFDTGIGTFFDKPMPETTCVFCGQCVGVCPTGALMFKSEHDMRETGAWDESRQAVTDTICPYCGVGCNLTLHVQDSDIV